jgi:hypothetical protein
LEAERARLIERIAELRPLVNAKGYSRQVIETVDVETTDAAVKPQPKKRRKMSAAGRKRIGDASRKRWAALKNKQ